MTNGTRNVTKHLAGAEDLLFGAGKVTQTRGGVPVQVHRLDLFLPVEDEAELAATNQSNYPKARIGQRLFVSINGEYQELYNVEPVLFNVGSVLTTDYNYCANNDIVAKWLGALPKVLNSGDASFTGPNWQIIGGSGTIVIDKQVAHLKALPPTGSYDGEQWFVTSFYEGGVDGGGTVIWKPTVSKATNNGGTIIAPEALAAWNGTEAARATLLNWTGSGAGCWVRPLNGVNVTVDMFGASPGSADDVVSFVAAANAVAATGGGTVEFKRSHLLDSAFTVAKNVTLLGPLGSIGEFLPGTAADYDSKIGVLKINSAITVSFSDCSALKNCIVIRKNLDLPFANAAAAAAGVLAFAGTALTAAGPDVSFDNLLVLGFNKAVYSNGFERTRCYRVFGDCTNGIDIRTAYDIPHVFECHFWPFTTVHQTWTLDVVAPNFPQAGSLLTRSGRAYQYAAVGDWAKITNSFSYGYQNGFVIDSCDNVQLIGCGTDSYSELVGNTAVGYTWGGTSKDGLMLACQAASQGAGVDINLGITIGGSVRVANCNFWKNDSSALNITAGRCDVTGTKFRENNAAIVAGVDCRGLLVEGNIFDTETAPYTIHATALRVTTIGNNEFYNCVDTLGRRSLTNNGAATHTNIAASAASAGYTYIGAACRGSTALPTINSDGDIAATFRAQIYDGAAFRSVGMTRFQAQGAPAAGVSPGMFVISTTPTASASPTDRVAIYRNGDISPLADNAQSCGITGLRWSSVWAANGTIQTSDARTKTEVADSVLGLGFINALRPVSYKFIVGGKDVVRQVYRNANGDECEHDAEGAVPAEIITVDKPGTRTHWGLISNEVKSVADLFNVDFGGWVLTDKDDPNSQQALRYDQFISPLIKAVQELTKRVIELEGK